MSIDKKYNFTVFKIYVYYGNNWIKISFEKFMRKFQNNFKTMYEQKTIIFVPLSLYI